jgi:uncharacterized protein affecting Mg2+/Co2+ transport
MSDFENVSPKAKTPEKFDGPKDVMHKHPKAGVYPYYQIIRGGPEGGHITIDSSEGAESITIQGRGGETVQMAHGKIRITASDGMHTVVLGENRMVITGAHDIVVQGDCSLRVLGTQRTTVEGDVEMTVTGNYNITAENMNTTVRGNIDTVAKNVSTQVEGNMETSVNGLNIMGGDAGIAFASTSGSISMKAASELGIMSGSKMMVDAGGALHQKVGSQWNLQSGGKASIKAGGNFAVDGTQVLINSGASDNADDASITHNTPPTV